MIIIWQQRSVGGCGGEEREVAITSILLTYMDRSFALVNSGWVGFIPLLEPNSGKEHVSFLFQENM